MARTLFIALDSAEPRLLRQYADGTELRGPAGGAIWSAPKRPPPMSPAARCR
jgi:hypothetical protein